MPRTRTWSKNFSDRTVQKTYVALLHGKLKDEKGTIDLPVARDLRRRSRMTARRREGREARTDWRVRLRIDGFTLVEADLHTGRTHQIRVHFSTSDVPWWAIRFTALRGRSGLVRSCYRRWSGIFCTPRGWLSCIPATGKPVAVSRAASAGTCRICLRALGHAAHANPRLIDARPERVPIISSNEMRYAFLLCSFLLSGLMLPVSGAGTQRAPLRPNRKPRKLRNHPPNQNQLPPITITSGISASGRDRNGPAPQLHHRPRSERLQGARKRRSAGNPIFWARDGLASAHWAALDTSNSIRPRLSFEQEAAIDFLNRVIRRNKDMAFLMTFDNEPEVVQGFTGDLALLTDAIHNQRAGGGTALHDAIYRASEILSNPPLPPGPDPEVRRVIVVISDGDDNLSDHALSEAIEAAIRSETAIYAISTNTDWLAIDDASQTKQVSSC